MLEKTHVLAERVGRNSWLAVSGSISGRARWFAKLEWLCVGMLLSVWLVGCSCGDESDSPFKPTIEFTAPESGQTIARADDEDLSVSGIQYTVIATSSDAEEGDVFTLWLDPVTDCDGTELATTSADADGNITFAEVTLPEGVHELQICSEDGKIRSEKISITVEGSITPGECAEATFITPAPGSETTVVLSGADDTDGEACGATFTIDVSLSTNAENGQQVVLFVNGSSRATGTVQGTLVTFEDVVLDNRGDTPNSLEVEFAGASAEACTVPFPGQILVDCAGVSCSITKPAPESIFLSSAHDTSTDAGFQTDVEVTTDAEAIGQNVELVVDTDVAGASEAPVTAQGMGGVAAFGNVQLSEGVHRLQAVCTDSAGNITYSGVVEWTVDITACTVTIDSIANGSNPITDQDDQSATTDGIQVTATGSVSGAGCTGIRVGSCSGLPTDFSALSGSSWTGSVTLGSTASQTVCAEVQDEAGNIGTAQISVSVRTAAPQLEIVSPTTGTGFNTSGANGRTVDLNLATPTCEAAFVVNCSDVGVAVDLVNQETNAVLATATCTAVSGLPAPYLGQASFASVPLTSDDSGAATTIVARQTVGALTGLSTPITVYSDCSKPELSIARPTCGTVLRPSTQDEDAAPGFQYEVRVTNSNSPQPPVTLELRDASGTVINSATSSTVIQGVLTVFPNFDFGSGGTLQLVACATDPAGNVGCAPSCSVTVAELPTLAITQPADNASLSSANDCSANAGLQIQVTATTDAANGSAATVQVGSSASPVNTTVSSGIISVCTDATDGIDIPITVTVTDNRGTASATISVNVDTLPPTTSIDDLSVTFTGANRRAGVATFSWTAVSDAGGGTLSSYQLRCSATPITDVASWDAATAMPITTAPAAGGTPQSTTIGGFRLGDSVYCALRGVDAGGTLTPLASPASIAVTPNFLQQLVTAASSSQMGFRVTGVGDINGDNIDDVLVSSFNAPAYLYFGSASGLASTPQVTLRGITSGGFGAVIGALGDVSGDGVPDFAITQRANNKVHVFFGRPSSNPWPSSIDLGTAACVADICFTSTDAGGLGWSVTGLDFNGDDTNDIAIGAPSANTTGRVYVVLGGSQLVVSAAANSFDIPSTTALKGFYVNAPVSPVIGRLGNGVGTAGDFIGGDGFDDLAIGANGSNPNVMGALLTLGGRAYGSADTGFVAIASTALQTVDTGIAGSFGERVQAVGDYNGDGRIDLAVTVADGPGSLVVYLQTASGFTSGSKLTIANNVPNAVGDVFGGSIGEGWHSWMGLLGDMDEDGLADIFVGSDQYGTGPGTGDLFYGSAPAVNRLRAEADLSVAGTAGVRAAYIGDVNADGFDDMAIGDYGYSSNAGRLIILY